MNLDELNPLELKLAKLLAYVQQVNESNDIHHYHILADIFNCTRNDISAAVDSLAKHGIIVAQKIH